MTTFKERFTDKSIQFGNLKLLFCFADNQIKNIIKLNKLFDKLSFKIKIKYIKF